MQTEKEVHTPKIRTQNRWVMGNHGCKLID